MKVLAWNCQGLACAPTIHPLWSLNRLHKPVIIFLSKTKIQPAKICLVLKKIGFSSCVQIPSIGLNGGLFLAWKNEVDLEPIKQDAQSDHMYGLLWFSPSALDVFFCVCSLSASFIACLLGASIWNWQLLSKFLAFTWEFYFNSIHVASKKSGGRAYGSQFHCSFEDFVHSNGLIDLGFNGNKFTRSNHKHGIGNIKERLDKGLANRDWVLLYPKSLINHLPATNSDRYPLLLSLKGSY